MADQDINQLRHSAAHLLAHALLELFPKTILTIGPATKDGFFYDFLPETNLKESDLPAIEARMLEIANRNLPIEHTQIPKAKARELFKGNWFKLELIDGIPDDTAGLATQGDFHDLCKGGHVASTGLLKHFKLLNISGSYWRADRNDQPLQRISGVVFFTEKELNDYLTLREEAMKYDHRKLGKQMDLFSFHDEGVGFPFFHPKGKIILNIMAAYMRKQLEKFEYKEISTPIMLNEELWKQSGHYAHYKENMYFCHMHEDQETYAVRPMNCPGSALLYRERPRSYRDLPLRLAEFGLDHRYEISGALHGLFRVRAFTQDDGHIYCTVDQIKQEVLSTITMVHEVMHKFGFEKISIRLSTRPEKSLGTDEFWAKAEQSLKDALDAAGAQYIIQEGEGAFYGPKIEFHIEDAMGRTWQCSTVQLDFFLPQNFDLTYVNSHGQKEYPVVIHRAIYGTFERFLGVMTEHYKGNFPFWLSPVQVKVLTITDEQRAYADNIMQQLKKAEIRSEMDESSDPISGKIKSAQLDKIPWMLVIGNKEVENKTVTLRHRDGRQEFGLSLEDVIARGQELNRF
jgi:threonyl-tRNA synthetase